jgi:hypothetical protein
MEGKKGKRSSVEHGALAMEGKGKGKRSSVEHRGAEDRGPKIRKVTQEEMGKLQIKEREKPMELEKMRRLEEKRKVVPIARMPEEEINVYRYAVNKDFESLLYKEEHACLWPGGRAQMMDVNEGLRRAFKRFKEHSARRLEEYETNGYLEYSPPTPSAKRFKKYEGKQEQSTLHSNLYPKYAAPS